MEDSVTKERNKRALRALIGFGTTVLALACGSEDSNNANTAGTGGTAAVDVEPPPTRPVEEDPCANPLAATCPTAVQKPPIVTTTPDKPPTQEELDRASVENILESNCGYCHGPKLTAAQAKAGMNYIDDIDKLVLEGKVLPMNSAGSPIVQRMVRGLMPPPGSGYPAVTDADIDKVAAFIDNPRYWDVPDANCTDQDQLVDFDQLYQDINDDLRDADNNDAQFFRYISITNRFTAGVCAEGGLDRDRQGLIKMMNMLSIKASTGDVVPANDDETLYRIDLRDFDWDRAVDVNGAPFTDVWEAIADANPYAVEFFGDDADEAKDDALTAFPVMFADQMMDVAIIGNLYYSIIGVDVAQPLSTFITGLGIDVDANIEEEEAIRAGTSKSRISRQDRLVERHDIGIRGGAYWQSFDFANDANESIFEDPFGFTPGGTEAIFTLPNGMLAYIIADANDTIVEDSAILLDTNQNNFRAVTSVSCSNCHATGFIPVVDEVRDIAVANAREIGLNNDQLEQLKAIYVAPDAFARKAKQDSEGFYQRALQLVDLPIQGGDPVSGVFLRFDQDMTLNDAAGDLGVTPDDLENSIDLLNPVLSILDTANGTIDRDDFTNVFVESLCELTSSLQNTPDPVVCDALLGN
ncbi:MAG: Serine/threonine-protein kinase pkn1 [Pseudomonadota bacterium]